MRKMGILRRRALSRRTFLRGAGAAVALPWLDAMVPALARGAQPAPLRSVFLFTPNGRNMASWRPTGGTGELELPYTLEPLAGVRDRVVAISGLGIDAGRPHGDGPGDHARSAAPFLTCAHPVKTGGADIRAGVSVDQLLAARIGAATRFPSLELGMERGRLAGSCDSGYSCAYSNCVSWKTPTTPVPKEIDPYEVFARLFGDPDEIVDEDRKAREARRRRSVLDAVLADARALERTLGTRDRQKLDEYLTAVRELEARLQRPKREGVEVEVPDGLFAGVEYSERLKLMYDLIVLALRTDLTRTVTFMVGNAGSNRSYPFIDIPEGHHYLSHHRGDRAKLAKIRGIDRFHVEQLAGFLQGLRAVDEGGADLLEHTAVVYGSGLGDGNRHDHMDLPVLLAGGGYRGGRQLTVPKHTPMADLLLALMHRAGVREDSFADSTGPLSI